MIPLLIGIGFLWISRTVSGEKFQTKHFGPTRECVVEGTPTLEHRKSNPKDVSSVHAADELEGVDTHKVGFLQVTSDFYAGSKDKPEPDKAQGIYGVRKLMVQC